MDKLLIIGARQHAKVLVAIIEEFYGRQFSIAGCLDDDPTLAGSELLGHPVLGTLAELENVVASLGIAGVAIGISNRYMILRGEMYDRVKGMGLSVPSLIHDRAYVSKRAELGDGVVLNPGVVVNAYSAIGNNTVIYSNSTIEHETRLSDNVYIGPGVNFSSNARVGKGTFIGAGARIIPDINIGSNVVVGAGSVVIEDVPDGVTVAGVPARIINKSVNTVI